MKKSRLFKDGHGGETSDLDIIHESLVNGQRKQMVNQINEYGLYDFWSDYREYLGEFYVDKNDQYDCFSDAVISYHRLTNR